MILPAWDLLSLRFWRDPMLTASGHFETIWDLNLQAKEYKARAGPSIMSRGSEGCFLPLQRWEWGQGRRM